MRRSHLDMRTPRPEKQSPAFRTLVDYITGGHGAALEEEIIVHCAKLNEREKELYRQKLAERYATLKSVTDGSTTEYALNEYVAALKTVSFIAKHIGLDLDPAE